MPFDRAPSLDQLAERLASGSVTARQLVDDCLARIDEPQGEGSRTFLQVAHADARAVADAMDALRAAGAAPSRFAGIPISIKDLFDIKGHVTTAGSKVLADRPPADQDAPAVARLRRAGFIVIGRTNMTEFAFSGVGLNPHHGTPACVWDRAAARIPGGSSSGAAISVVDGMAHMGLGTDTGGSCRIPAAYNGLVGYKPTAARVPTAGAIPLSTTLDSIGPIARTVACCASVDAILAGDEPTALAPAALSRLRFVVPERFVLDDLDQTVAADFERTLLTLSAAGADVERRAMAAFDEIPDINAKGGFAAPEALAWHHPLLARRERAYDPRVSVRIKRGGGQTAVDYIQLIERRRTFIARIQAATASFDAMLIPTVPTIAPRIQQLEADDDYAKLNVLALRNPSVINLLDGCAISVPMHRAGTAPTGLMIAGPRGGDRALFRVAAAVEAALAEA